MSEITRYHSRSDVKEVELPPEREEQLREAFDMTECHGERIGDCVAVVLTADEPFNDSGIVTSTRLHHDRIFDLVASYAAGDEDTPGDEITASATVKDLDNESTLSAHATEDQLLISARDPDVPFQSFRDYVLFLEQSLNVTLTPEME